MVPYVITDLKSSYCLGTLQLLLALTMYHSHVSVVRPEMPVQMDLPRCQLCKNITQSTTAVGDTVQVCVSHNHDIA